MNITNFLYKFSILIFVVVIVLISSYIFFYPDLLHMEKIERSSTGPSNVSKLEDSFSKDKDLFTCMKLQDYYLHVKQIRNIDKSIHYGKKCLNLNCTSNCKFYVHFKLSIAYHKKRDFTKACSHFKKANKFDKENKIYERNLLQNGTFNSGFLLKCTNNTQYEILDE